MHPNVYKFSELIEGVTTHPVTKRCVESHAKAFKAAQDPNYQDIVIRDSPLTVKKVMRWLTVMENEEDAIYNSRFKRLMYNLTGTCTGALCVGWNCLQSKWGTTYEIDQEFGTDYRQRLRKWLEYAQGNALTVAGAGIPSCMHGGGSPDAKLVIRAAARWDDYIDYACKLAGVKKKDFPVK